MPRIRTSSVQSVWPPPPPPDESEQARLERIAAEEEAKRVSDSIDRTLERKRGPHAKILLLGQAESGKSTILKNFQLNFSPKSFAAEAEVWRPIIHLNLVRSINFILNLLADSSREHSSHQPLYDTLSGDLRRLCIGLAPLREVEASLTRGLSGTSPILPDGPYYNPNRASEVAIRSSAGWKAFLMGRRRAETASRSADRSDAADRRILAACAEDMSRLWQDPSVQDWLRGREISLHEQPGLYVPACAPGSLDSDPVPCAPASWTTSPGSRSPVTCRAQPAADDILRARVATIGPEEHHINLEKPGTVGREWVIYDVGGSRSQRPAWAQYFDDVNVIIFLAPLSGFNQALAEDKTVNRLTDSMKLWKMICSNQLLASVELILFLNKLDVLDTKLRKDQVQFSRYVKTYRGTNETKPVAKYLLDVFVTLHHQNTPRKRKIHPHLTCAIDTKATCSVIDRIHELVIVKTLSASNIL
ncbi:hypothetical protein DXG01_001171 [Tephrocybe rancida]|nr:hypothetical protein DXG01_001171 [Tephrocybe rancida]